MINMKPKVIPLDGWVCDVCNCPVTEIRDNRVITTVECTVTDWGLYCPQCREKYKVKGEQISKDTDVTDRLGAVIFFF